MAQAGRNLELLQLLSSLRCGFRLPASGTKYCQFDLSTLHLSPSSFPTSLCPHPHASHRHLQEVSTGSQSQALLPGPGLLKPKAVISPPSFLCPLFQPSLTPEIQGKAQFLMTHHQILHTWPRSAPPPSPPAVPPPHSCPSHPETLAISWKHRSLCTSCSLYLDCLSALPVSGELLLNPQDPVGKFSLL